MDQNTSEEVWIGPYDDAPDCVYNDGVGCYHHHCEDCGWNPFVSLARITVKYGEKAADHLTMNAG